MNQRYKEALSEVEYIINQLMPEDLEKIPKSFRNFISENRCKWYELKDIDNLREETYAILSIIYRKFLAPINERIELEKEYQEKLKKEKEELNNIINNNKTISSSEISYDFVSVNIDKNDNVQLIEHKKERWYQKLFNKIKCLVWSKKVN